MARKDDPGSEDFSLCRPLKFMHKRCHFRPCLTRVSKNLQFVWKLVFARTQPLKQTWTLQGQN